MFSKFVSAAKNILPIFIFVFACLFLCFNLSKDEINSSEIPLLGGINSDIRINVEGEAKVYADGKELQKSSNAYFNSYQTYELNNYPVKSIRVEGDNIKNSVVSVASKLYFFKNGGFNLDEKYTAKRKNLADRGIFKSFQTKTLALFYGKIKFLFPIFLIYLILFFLYVKNKAFKSYFSKIKDHLIWVILLYALFLRLGDLSASFWTDELYSAYMAGNINLPFLMVFSDPGNPPFFFILVRYWELFFGFSEAYLRILPLIFSLGTIFVTYIFAKEFVLKEVAVIAALLMSLNVYSIVFAQELRCYSLLMFLSILMSLVLLKLVKALNNKMLVFYSILCAISFNTHYFSAFIILSNFILGMILIKDKKIQFLLSNILGFVCFLPYLFITGLQKGLFDETFNLIQFPDFLFYLKTFNYYYHGYLALIILALCSIVIFCKNNQYKKPLFYMLYMIISVFVSTFLFSYIKPIAQEWYFVCLLPYFIILYSIIISFLYQTKKPLLVLISLVLFWILPFHDSSYIKRDRSRLLNFDNLAEVYENLKDEKSMLFIPHSKEMLNLRYKINNDEMIVCANPQAVSCLINGMENSDKETFFIRLDYKIMNSFFDEGLKKHNISFIRLDKDVIIAKVRKK